MNPLSQLDAKQKKDFCSVIAVGCDRDTVCRLLGVTNADLHRELAGDAEFARQVQKAEAGAELGFLRCVHKAVNEQNQWRAALWWLERRLPERYARRRAQGSRAEHIAALLDEIAEAVFAVVLDSHSRQRLLQRFTEACALSDERRPGEFAPPVAQETSDG